MNFWQETPGEDASEQNASVVDVVYRIDCPELPVDNAYALSAALQAVAPWYGQDGGGVHPIYGAPSGNGWQRPERSGATMQLSKRTRLRLRVSGDHLPLALDLAGTRLDVAGYTLVLSRASVKPLLPAATLFARYLMSAHGDDEEKFMHAAAAELQAMGIAPLRLLAGKAHRLFTPTGTLAVQSLLIDALTPVQSLNLQRNGIGPGRRLGCGLFVPHRGIAAVGAVGEDPESP